MATMTTGSKNYPENRSLGQGCYEAKPGCEAENKQGGTENSSLADQARTAGTAVLEKAKDAAETAFKKAGEVGEKVDSAVAAAGSGMSSLAGAIRENLPREGMLGAAPSSVACGLESGGRYLQEERLSGLVKDMAGVIRNYPIPTLLIGIGLGFTLARSLRN